MTQLALMEEVFMLPLPAPQLNGVTITHEELRALHTTMREAIKAATDGEALTGPRLLIKEDGESYTLKAHGRDRDGNLLASVTIHTRSSRSPYVRKVRLIRSPSLKPQV